jgi:hypothetical protein
MRSAKFLPWLAAIIAAPVLFTSGPAQAATYYFHPGHPMFFGFVGNPNDYCTGGFAVRGASGMFIVTAGHCSTDTTGRGSTGAVVYGTGRRFGTIIRNDLVGDFYTTNTFDGALVQLDPGDDALQIVVDPLTGRSPGNGQVRGWYANSALTQGFVIGKMGNTTGWTEGTITGWQTVMYPNGWRDFLLCTTVPIRGGDSGGPVWRWDANGIMAIGITIARLDTGGMCFNPIENVLNRFGAWLPVFGPSGFGPGAQQPLVITESIGKPLPVSLEPVPAQLM